ncbi:hypothetical protein L7F22_049590 [Adiantum nelumboides]|nr:hypothetical protein [Adiantum nelumboides]
MIIVPEALQLKEVRCSGRNEVFLFAEEHAESKVMSWLPNYRQNTNRQSSYGSTHVFRYTSSISTSSLRWPHHKDCTTSLCTAPGVVFDVPQSHCPHPVMEATGACHPPRANCFVSSFIQHSARTSALCSKRISCQKTKKGKQRLSPIASIGTLVAASGAITTSTASQNPHSAVISTLTQLAVTAIAIASGACLSTQVDYLWPRSEESPQQLLLEGVDVTGYKIFEEPEVVKALSFAKEAHSGQMRKTGEPYLTHCIHTAKVLAALVPETGSRVFLDIGFPFLS